MTDDRFRFSCFLFDIDLPFNWPLAICVAAAVIAALYLG